VLQSECCECTYGPGHFCGDQKPNYLKGDDCLVGALYTCREKDQEAIFIYRCFADYCLHLEGPTGSYCA
jgi:hypothetical protein